MPVIVCHSIKGGTGTTFVAAHVAVALCEAGAEVTVLTMARRDTMPLHFGLPPALTLPSLFALLKTACWQLVSTCAAMYMPRTIPILYRLCAIWASLLPVRTASWWSMCPRGKPSSPAR